MDAPFFNPLEIKWLVTVRYNMQIGFLFYLMQCNIIKNIWYLNWTLKYEYIPHYLICNGNAPLHINTYRVSQISEILLKWIQTTSHSNHYCTFHKKGAKVHLPIAIKMIYCRIRTNMWCVNWLTARENNFCRMVTLYI